MSKDDFIPILGIICMTVVIIVGLVCITYDDIRKNETHTCKIYTDNLQIINKKLIPIESFSRD